MEASTAAASQSQSSLDWLRSIRVIIGRPTSTSSVLADHDGRRCLVAFTAIEPMTTWWKQRSHKSLRTAVLLVPELVERWGAPDVDLLLDPGTPQQRHIPITTLRAHLGLGPVIADGDGTEPVRFVGFSTNLYSAAKGLVLVPFSVFLIVLAVATGQAGIVLVGLAILAASLLIARSTFRELRAAVATRAHRRATRTAASGPPGHPPPTPTAPAPGHRSRRSRRGVVVGAAFVVALALAAVVVAGRGGEGDDSGEGSRVTAIGAEVAQGVVAWSSQDGANSYDLVTPGDLVCGTTVHGSLYCLDATTGDVSWQVGIGDVPGSVTVVDDTLLVLSESSSDAASDAVGLAAYSLDGEQVWASGETAVAEVAERPAVAGGVVAFRAGPAMSPDLVGLDTATGEERWRVPGGDDVDSPLWQGAVHSDGHRFYVVDRSQGTIDVVALDPASGDELWRWSAPRPMGTFDSLASVDGGAAVGLLVLGNEGMGGHVAMVDTTSGAPRWEAEVASDYGSLAYLDGVLVVVDGGDLRGYDPDGGLVWEAADPNIERHPDLVEGGNLVVADGTLYEAGFDVYEIDPHTGETRMVIADVDAEHVATAGDHLVAAGTLELVSVVPNSALSG